MNCHDFRYRIYCAWSGKVGFRSSKVQPILQIGPSLLISPLSFPFIFLSVVSRRKVGSASSWCFVEVLPSRNLDWSPDLLQILSFRLTSVFIFPFLMPVPDRVFQLEPGDQHSIHVKKFSIDAKKICQKRTTNTVR